MRSSSAVSAGRFSSVFKALTAARLIYACAVVRASLALMRKLWLATETENER